MIQALRLLALLLPACALEDGIVFVITTEDDFSVDDAQVEVMVSFANADGEFCDPGMGTDQPSGPSPQVRFEQASIPLSLRAVVVPGEFFGATASLRARLLEGGDERARRYSSAVFAEGEHQEIAVVLDLTCPACALDEECDEGQCRRSVGAQIFGAEPRPAVTDEACAE
jgi:hypothetical protein